MSRTIEPAKPKLKHLMVLKRMVEEDLGLVTTTSLSHNSISFFKRDLTSGGRSASYDWFRINIGDRAHIISLFYQWGWTNVLTKPEWNKGTQRNGIFSWNDQPYVLNKLGLAYWNETGKAEYERLSQIETDTRSKVERLVAIRANSSHYRTGGRKAGMLVRVIRETDNRLYVEPVCGDDPPYYQYLTGRDGQQYISRDQVTIDGLTEQKYHTIREVEDTIQAEQRVLHDEETRDIREIHERYANRKLQKSAEHDDLFQRALK